MTVVGFIGLGAMGGAMSANILKKGYAMVVHDLVPEREQRLVDLGASPAASPAEVARRADVVITSVPGGQELRQVILGNGGLLEGFSPKKALIDMSTVGPKVCQEMSAVLAGHGVRMLDAPVARTKQAAVDGTLAIMVGGDRADLDEFMPILRCMGTDVFYCGPAGSGQVVKLLNNLTLMCNITVLAECLSLGVKAGVAAQTLVDVLSVGSAGSFALQNHIRKSVLTGDFAENRFPVTYALKDIEYALAMGKDHGIPMLHGAIAQQLCQVVNAMGYGENYFPIVFEVLERQAGIRVRST